MCDNANWMIADEDWDREAVDRCLPFGGACISVDRHRKR
jgi:hypothetical protein